MGVILSAAKDLGVRQTILRCAQDDRRKAQRLISDLVSYEADSMEALAEAFEEVVEDCLSFCKETGKVPQRTLIKEISRT